MVLGTNIPEKMAWAGHFFLKILIRDWNIGPSCKNGLCSDRSTWGGSAVSVVLSLRSASAASRVVMLVWLVQLDKLVTIVQSRVIPAKRTYRIMHGSNIEDVICELWTAKRSTAWTMELERNMMWTVTESIYTYSCIKGPQF